LLMNESQIFTPNTTRVGCLDSCQGYHFGGYEAYRHHLVTVTNTFRRGMQSRGETMISGRTSMPSKVHEYFKKNQRK
jgi:hypothetical protein